MRALLEVCTRCMCILLIVVDWSAAISLLMERVEDMVGLQEQSVGSVLVGIDQ